MKGEDKRKTLAMMVFNDVQRRAVEKLKKRKNKTNAVKNYLKIIDSHSEKDVNQAKAILRSGVFHMMNEDWIFHKALHARFRTNERQNQIVLEQYMTQFKRELGKGEIMMDVDKDEVLRIPSAIVRRGF